MKARRWVRGLAVTGLSVVCGWFVYQGVMDVRIQNEIYLAQQAGIPTKAADRHRKPTAQNAADYYRIAIRAWLALPSNVRSDTVRAMEDKGPWTPERLARLDPIRPMLEDVRRAASISDLDFERDYQQGYAMLLPEYAQMLQFIRAMNALADAEAQSGNREKALDWLATSAAVSRHAGADELAIGTAVRARGESWVLQHLAKIEATPPEAKPIVAALGPLPNAFRDLSAEFLSYTETRRVARDGAYWSQILTALGLKQDNIEGTGFTDWLYQAGWVTKSTDFNSLQALRRAIMAVPAHPEHTVDFAGYLAEWQHLPGQWSPLNHVVYVNEKLGSAGTGYADAYLSLVANRHAFQAALSGESQPDPFGDTIQIREEDGVRFATSQGPASGNQNPIEFRFPLR